MGACMSAKALQSCPTLCDPMACSLPGSSVHGDSPGKNAGVGCHALLQGIFLTQRSNISGSYISCIGRQVLYHWHQMGRPQVAGPVVIFTKVLPATVGMVDQREQK